MRITKFVHSCLLVEDAGRVGIIDPGKFSWESGLFNIDEVNKLDDIIITHEHFDHMHIPFLQALTVKFPEVRITTTLAAAAQLKKANFIYATNEPSSGIEIFNANHESLQPFGGAPQNIGVNYLERLTHPGDSHSFDSVKEILALPITAPWGHITAAAELTLKLKPKFVIPIHDWHWNSAARQQAYDQMEAFFKPLGVKFIKIKDTEPIEL